MNHPEIDKAPCNTSKVLEMAALKVDFYKLAGNRIVMQVIHMEDSLRCGHYVVHHGWEIHSTTRPSFEAPNKIFLRGSDRESDFDAMVRGFSSQKARDDWITMVKQALKKYVDANMGPFAKAPESQLEKFTVEI